MFFIWIIIICFIIDFCLRAYAETDPEYTIGKKQKKILNMCHEHRTFDQRFNDRMEKYQALLNSQDRNG